MLPVEASLEPEYPLQQSSRTLPTPIKHDHHIGDLSLHWLDPAQRAVYAENTTQRIKAGQWVDVAREETIASRFFQEVDLSDDATDPVFVVGEDEDGAEAVHRYEELAVDPMSFTFGSGKAMAKLYR